MEELLIRLRRLRACKEAREWAEGMSWQEVYATCHRGDWLLWLFARTNPNNRRELTLAKGHCANTVRHLMKDPRSIAAVNAAIAYGEGKIDDKELADAGYAAAYAANAYAAAYATATAAAYAAAATTAADAYDAYIAAADAAAAADDDTAASENQRLTADICRKYLPIEIWNI